jgi:hypothetical protein
LYENRIVIEASIDGRLLLLWASFDFRLHNWWYGYCLYELDPNHRVGVFNRSLLRSIWPMEGRRL